MVREEVGSAVRSENLSKTYRMGDTSVHALTDVTVSFRAGAFTAIMGPSGSGKSTLMHCLAGLDSATSGKVYLGETELTALDDTALAKLRRLRIGFVFQSFNLLPALTVEQNILLPFELAGREGPDDAWFSQLITTLGLDDRIGHLPSELSGGQQQRAAIARALLTRPDVVFADEPTKNLDSAASARTLGFLRESVDHFGQTVVMVTHDPLAAAYADRVILLADGALAGQIDAPTSDAILAALGELGT